MAETPNSKMSGHDFVTLELISFLFFLFLFSFNVHVHYIFQYIEILLWRKAMRISLVQQGMASTFL